MKSSHKKVFATLLCALSTFAQATENQEVSETDGGWPRVISSEAGAKVKIYQPQVEEWKDQKSMVAWSAVEFLASGRTQSELGAVKWEAQTAVAMEERLAQFQNIRLNQVSFPTLNQAQSRDITKALSALFPKEGLVIALDRVLAAVDKSAINAKGVAINQNPPPIFYASRPSLLVQFDGEPILSPIKDSTLKFVVNTNWDMFQDQDTKQFYLRHEKVWFSGPSIEGEWVPVKKLPKSFETLPMDANWDDVKTAMPPKDIRKSNAPLLYFSKQPAELILTTGKPKTEAVGKSKLLWIKNTESDVFQMKKGNYYFLVSGRWFSAAKLEGPWKFATPELPAEFLNIPRTHPRARVRASIPGTDEAAEAILVAQIPRTLQVKKENLESPKVTYQGEPQFKEIKGTKASYATNCSNDVLKVGEMYYLCFQGAWLQSRRADGPWALASKVPDEIYKIPSDCPIHHVTYVRVESSNTESVTYICDSGYSGVTVSFGVAMWGTGWYYPPYYYGGGYYPVYYPYPHSYGGNAIYNPRTGAYGYGSKVSGPNGSLAHAATYNPNTGSYRRGTAVSGPSGSQFRGQAYNPRTGTSMQTQQGRNDQGSWGKTQVSRGDDWAKSGHVKTDAGKISGIKTSEGSGMIRGKGEEGSGFVGKKGDDIYAGKDGNVYRKTEDGWQQRTEGGWSDVDANRPSAGTRDQVRDNASVGTRDQLNRDAGNRASGNERVRSSDRSSRGSYSGGSRGSYGGGSRGSYGGGRGGGGRMGGGGRRR